MPPEFRAALVPEVYWQGTMVISPRAGRRALGVRSRGEVCRIDPEPVWLVCPGFADELVGGEAAEGLEPTGVVVGIQKELEVARSWAWPS